MSGTSWAYNGMIDDECGNYYNDGIIEQVSLTPENPPYVKRKILPTSVRFIEGIKDFWEKSKFIFSMKGVNTKGFNDVLGTDRRAANDTFW